MPSGIHRTSVQEGRGARETQSHSPSPLGHPSPPAKAKKNVGKDRSGLFPCPLKWRAGTCGTEPIISGIRAHVCHVPLHTAQHQQQLMCVYVCMGTAHECDQDHCTGEQLQAAGCPSIHLSTCPPAVPVQHQGAHTFTNSPGGPGGPMGPSGPGGPGSPNGPRGPGVPGGPGLPWRTEMLC